ncbi:hypothetical protein T439DRAFT_44922 [Meredithblackwellia eburnea MCA 4105]
MSYLFSISFYGSPHHDPQTSILKLDDPNQSTSSSYADLSSLSNSALSPSPATGTLDPTHAFAVLTSASSTSAPPSTSGSSTFPSPSPSHSTSVSPTSTSTSPSQHQPSILQLQQQPGIQIQQSPNNLYSFSTLSSVAGTDLLSPSPTSPSTSSLSPNSPSSRQQNPTLLSPTRPTQPSIDHFLRTWTLDAFYTYITPPSTSSSTSSGAGGTGGESGFMCTRCQLMGQAPMEWDNPGRRKFGFYKCPREKPASITKRAREHSLRHFKDDESVSGGGGKEPKGHRRRRSEGDTGRGRPVLSVPSSPQIKDEDLSSSYASSNGGGGVSSREASPAREFSFGTGTGATNTNSEVNYNFSGGLGAGLRAPGAGFRPQHMRASSAPDAPAWDTSPSITCVEYEGNAMFHNATLEMDETPSEMVQDDDVASQEAQRQGQGPTTAQQHLLYVHIIPFPRIPTDLSGLRVGNPTRNSFTLAQAQAQAAAAAIAHQQQHQQHQQLLHHQSSPFLPLSPSFNYGMANMALTSSSSTDSIASYLGPEAGTGQQGFVNPSELFPLFPVVGVKEQGEGEGGGAGGGGTEGRRASFGNPFA